MLLSVFSTLFMHFMAFFLQAFLLLLVIIADPMTAAAVPTARPMPMPFIMDMLFEDESIISFPSNRIFSELFCPFAGIKTMLKFLVILR